MREGAGKMRCSALFPSPSSFIILPMPYTCLQLQVRPGAAEAGGVWSVCVCSDGK